jgi:hypothetical protein
LALIWASSLVYFEDSFITISKIPSAGEKSKADLESVMKMRLRKHYLNI